MMTLASTSAAPRHRRGRAPLRVRDSGDHQEGGVEQVLHVRAARRQGGAARSYRRMRGGRHAPEGPGGR
eukprot:3411347-Prymnesium_polylepis.1